MHEFRDTCINGKRHVCMYTHTVACRKSIPRPCHVFMSACVFRFYLPCRNKSVRKNICTLGVGIPSHCFVMRH